MIAGREESLGGGRGWDCRLLDQNMNWWNWWNRWHGGRKRSVALQEFGDGGIVQSHRGWECFAAAFIVSSYDSHDSHGTVGTFFR